METAQLTLFKTFTRAAERNDAHTSASAMLREFFENLDLPSIKLMLSDCKTISNEKPEEFFRQLASSFLYMQMAGNDFLESAEGLCNRCTKGAHGFIFKGTNIPFHFGILFEVKNEKVTDMVECSILWKQFPELDPGLQHSLKYHGLQIPAQDYDHENPPF
jgi:hypothetical protein